MKELRIKNKTKNRRDLSSFTFKPKIFLKEKLSGQKKHLSQQNFLFKSVAGFTLIELLVVISIIGMLSSIVLSSLNTARGKGANSAVKANLHNMRAQAELLYGAQNYALVCTNTVVGRMLDAATRAGTGTSLTCNTAPAGSCACMPGSGSSPTSWAAYVILKNPESGNNFWCVDSTGASKGRAGVIPGGQSACLP